jgi:hypothetical protein
MQRFFTLDWPYVRAEEVELIKLMLTGDKVPPQLVLGLAPVEEVIFAPSLVSQ